MFVLWVSLCASGVNIYALCVCVYVCVIRGLTSVCVLEVNIHVYIDRESKPHKFKCCGTQKMLEFIWRWSNLKCWVCSNLTLLDYEMELSCQICANLLFFNCGNEPINIWREWIFMLDNSNSPLLSPSELNLTTHTHLATDRCWLSITVYNRSFGNIGWSKQNYGKEIGHL